MTAYYKNPAISTESRVDDLLGRMGIDEKIAQMHAFWLHLSESGEHTMRGGGFTGAGDADRLKTQLAFGLGQITRPLGSRPVAPVSGVRALNRLQKFLVEETRLGIPAISHEECLSGIMAQGGTLFPSSLAFGATFDPALTEEVGRVIGMEARSIGCRQGLAPVLDVARDARWGRTEETFGEDPYLVGLMATHYVLGLQGQTRDLLATLKHYAGHSLSEGGRNHAPVNLGWRELNDTFLLPFEMAVRLADAGSVMPAYHDIDGEPCHASHHLLTKVLRQDWGFDGLIVADYIGISLLHQHHGVAADAAEAAALAFNAGLDVELPGDDCASHVKQALARGLLTQETIDEIVRRILVEKIRMGLFEKPYTDEAAICLQSPEAIDVARRVAEQSVVVLANDGILPLDIRKTIALIGPTAADPLAMLGDYSFPVHLIMSDLADAASEVVTPRAAFEEAFGQARILYAKGCNILEERQPGAPVFPGDVPDSAMLTQTSPVSMSRTLIPAAVDAARRADVAVVCVGDLSGIFQTGTVGEGSDTDTLDLPGVQQALLAAVVETGTPVVVVVTSGRPYTLGGLEDRVAAQVMAFFGGQEGGHALVDVLTGAVEPSGRLTVSVPRGVGASPYFYNHKFKSSGTPVARHFGSRYPFGHGLSYTRFVYEEIEVEPPVVPSAGGSVAVSFTVSNMGERMGVEVPQLYVRDVLTSVVRPVKELKAFKRVMLEPEESARVLFRVPTDMLSFTGPEGARIVEPGRFEIMVGSSSAAIHLRAHVDVIGPVRQLDHDWRMVSKASVFRP
jgi:beta-glucosidase